ncbi:MAG: hypothetical protein ACFB4I_02925 [Cyanophyceae cyanobacterium]
MPNFSGGNLRETTGTPEIAPAAAMSKLNDEELSIAYPKKTTAIA